MIGLTLLTLIAEHLSVLTLIADKLDLDRYGLRSTYGVRHLLHTDLKITVCCINLNYKHGHIASKTPLFDIIREKANLIFFRSFLKIRYGIKLY